VGGLAEVRSGGKGYRESKLHICVDIVKRGGDNHSERTASTGGVE